MQYYLLKYVIPFLVERRKTSYTSDSSKERLQDKKLNNRFKIDLTYPVLGICTYSNVGYIRYICYNYRLSKIESQKDYICKNSYKSIKKIEVLNRNSDGSIYSVDVTDAKNNFCDIDFFTDLYDMIKFHLLQTGRSLLDPNLLPDWNDKNKSILLTREIFDDNLLEPITTYEEFDRS